MFEMVIVIIATIVVVKLIRKQKYKNLEAEDRQLEKQINVVLKNAGAYRIRVNYISSAGNLLGEREIALNQ